jgi:predicted NACHT family NTPase
VYLGDATLPGFNAFTLTPFDAKQIASFARAWYNAQRELGRVDAVQARQKGTNLAAVALQPALRALAANPMLLTAMALIHQQDTRHPDERVCLNDMAMTLLLHRWERQRVSNDMLVGLLGDVNQARAFLDYIDQRAGLLIGRSSASSRPDTYIFYLSPSYVSGLSRRLLLAHGQRWRRGGAVLPLRW